MRFDNKYRWVAISLAIVFSMYIIGLPIVISACPMMTAKSGKMACCPDTPTSGVKITSPKNTSCCKVTLAAKPNTGEFVSSKLQIQTVTFFDILAIQAVVASLDYSTTGYTFSSNSPPLKNVIDIPLFTSSLLI